MEDDFTLEGWEVEAKERLKVLEETWEKDMREHWNKKRMEEDEQEMRESAEERAWENEYRKYTSTGEEWEIGEDW